MYFYSNESGVCLYVLLAVSLVLQPQKPHHACRMHELVQAKYFKYENHLFAYFASAAMCVLVGVACRQVSQSRLTQIEFTIWLWLHFDERVTRTSTKGKKGLIYAGWVNRESNSESIGFQSVDSTKLRVFSDANQVLIPLKAKTELSVSQIRACKSLCYTNGEYKGFYLFEPN